MMVLATAGIAMLVLVNESLRVIHDVRETESDFRRASAFLEAVAVWTSADLDRRLGSRPQGEWVLEIQRIDAALYVVTLIQPEIHKVLLQTTLYRPGPDHDES